MTLPITLPLVLATGYDKMWFGIFLVIVVELAQISPPVGGNLAVIRRLPGGSMARIARAAMPSCPIIPALAPIVAACPVSVSVPDLMACP